MSAMQETAEELIECHQGFVALLANRMADVYHVDVDDLMQQGRLGILRASESFDPARGVKFLTYAKYWILRKMQEWVWCDSGAIRVPAYRFGKVRFLEQSLHGFLDEEDVVFEKCVAVEETTRERADRGNVRRLLEEAISNLTPAQERVIRGYFYEGLNSMQLAEKFGVTHQAINMAKQDGLRRLRGVKLLKEELSS